MGVYHLKRREGEFKVDIQINGKILPNLIFITNWTLAKIKKFYLTFKKISHGVNYRYISRETFIALLEWLEISSPDLMFEELDYKNKDRINVFQLLAILIWTSFSNRHHKLKFAFSLFDFNGDESISFDELIIFFIATCRGIGKLTRVPVPKSSMLKEVAATLFYLYDVNNTKTLELKEIATWLETCKDFSAFLEKYEPKTKILEKKSLFASFPPNQIDAFSPEVLRANQISCSGRSTIEPRNVRKPRRLKAIRADFYSVNFSQLKMAKLLSSKIDKFTKNLYMQVPRPSLDVVTPVHKVVLQRESCLARLNTTLTGSWVSPKIFPKSSLYLDKERVNRESIPYQYFGGTTLKKTESADTKKRLFKFNKFTPKVLGPPIVKEVPKEFMVYWKEAYDILQSVSEFNLHMYLSIVKAKPHLKNVFDKYLVLKSQTPTIACKIKIVRKAFEVMLKEVHRNVGTFQLNSMLSFVTGSYKVSKCLSSTSLQSC